MALATELEQLLQQAKGLVTEGVKSQGSFGPFALAMQSDGNVTQVKTQGFHPNPADAIGELLGTLVPLAVSRKIKASIIAMPLDMDGIQAVMFDLDYQDGSRINVPMTYHPDPASGCVFTEFPARTSQSKLFARRSAFARFLGL
jgi:hypothetical protein